MRKLLFASVFALSFGCGQKVPTALEKQAVVPAAPAAQMIPVQQQVTRYDAQGRPYVATETVMVPVATSAPAVRPVAGEPIRVFPKDAFVPSNKLNTIPKQKEE